LGCFLSRAGDHIAPLILGEESDMIERADRSAERLCGKRHLDKGQGEPAVRNVMHGSDLARSDESSNEVAMASFLAQIDRRGCPFLAGQDLAQIDRLAEMAAMSADQQNGFALGFEAQGRHFLEIWQEADAANGWRWEDRLAVGLVVERHVAR